MLPRPRANPVAVAIATAAVLLCVVAVLPGGAEAQTGVLMTINTPYAGDTILSGTVASGPAEWRVQLYSRLSTGTGTDTDTLLAVTIATSGAWTITLPATSALQPGQTIWVTTTGLSGTAVEGVSSTYTVATRPITFSPLPMVGDDTISGTTTGGAGVEIRLTINTQLLSTTTTLSGGSWEFTGLTPLADGNIIYVEFTDVNVFSNTVTVQHPSIAFARTPFIGQTAVKLAVNAAAVATGGMTVSGYFSPDNFATTSFLFCAPASAITDSTAIGGPIPAPTPPQTAGRLFVALYNGVCDGLTYADVASASIGFSIALLDYAPNVGFLGGVPQPGASTFTARVTRSGPNSLAALPFMVATTVNGELVSFGCTSVNGGYQFDRAVNLPSQLADGDVLAVFVDQGLCPSTIPADAVTILTRTISTPAPTIAIDRVPFIGMSTVRFHVTNAVSGQTVRVYSRAAGNQQLSCQSAMAVAMASSTLLSSPIPSDGVFIVVTATACDDPPLAMTDAAAPGTALASSEQSAPYSMPVVTFGGFPSAIQVWIGIDNSGIRPLSLASSSLIVKAATGDGGYACVSPPVGVPSTNTVAFSSPALGPGGGMHAFWTVGSCPSTPPSLSVLQASDPVVTIEFAYPYPAPTITITGAPVAGATTVSGTVTNAAAGSSVVLSPPIGSGVVAAGGATWTVTLSRRLEGGESLTATVTAAAPNGQTATSAPVVVGMYTAGYRVATATGGVLMTAEQLPGGPYKFQSTMTGRVSGENEVHSVFFYSQSGFSAGALWRKQSDEWIERTFTTGAGAVSNFANGGGIDIGVGAVLTFYFGGTGEGGACVVPLVTGTPVVNCAALSSLSDTSGAAPGADGTSMRVLDGGGDLANNALVDTVDCGIWVVTEYSPATNIKFSRLSNSPNFDCNTSPQGLPALGAVASFDPDASWFGEIYRATMRVRNGDTQVFVQTEAATGTLYLLTIFDGRIGTGTATPTVRAVAPMFSGTGAYAGGIGALSKALFVSNQFAIPTVLADLALGVSAAGMVSGVSSPSSMFSTRGGVPIPAFTVGNAASFIETIHGPNQDQTISPRRLTETTRVAFVQGGAIYTAPFSAITDALQYNPCDLSVYPAVCSSSAQNSASVGGGATIFASTCSFDAINDPTNPAPCVCPARTTGDGSALSPSPCVDIDECATDNGGCAYTLATTTAATAASVILPDLECTNNGGVPQTCSSTAFFVALPSGEFEDVNECATGNGGCGLEATSTCTNNIGAAPTCGCALGYARVNGAGPCVDIDGCDGATVPSGTSCADVAAPGEGATFPCLSGYERDAGMETCTACALGHFLDATAGDVCTPCGADANDATVTTDTEASVGRAACECAVGHYFDGSDTEAPWAVNGVSASCTPIHNGQRYWSPGGHATLDTVRNGGGACPGNSAAHPGYASAPSGRHAAGTSEAPEFTGTMNDCLCDLDYKATFTAGVLSQCMACGQGERTLMAFGALACEECTHTYEYVESDPTDASTDAAAGPIRACRSCDTRTNVAPAVLGENYVDGPYTGAEGCVAGCDDPAANLFHSTIKASELEAHCIDLGETPCAFDEIAGKTSPCWELDDTIFATCSPTSTAPFHVCVCPAGYVADENDASSCRALAKNEWRKLDPFQDGIAVAEVCKTGTNTATSEADRFAPLGTVGRKECQCDSESKYYGGGETTHAGCQLCAAPNVVVPDTSSGAGAGATKCAPCPDGQKFVDGTGCVLCAIGSYCVNGNQYLCSTKPNSDSTAPGAATCTCNAGFSSSGSGSNLACTPCVAGTFKASAGNGACTDCTAGNENGGFTTSCAVPCTQNSFCPAGLPPQQCPDSVSTDAANDGTTDTVGSDDVTDCKCIAGYKQVTAAGATCVQCPAGSYGTDGRTCSACETPMYNPTAGATGCETCDDGSVTSKAAGAADEDGNVACTACHGDSTESSNVCECNAGYYNDASDSCAKCPVGKFKDAVGNTACDNCAGGTTGGEGRDATCTDACPANSYCPDGEPPALCPASGAADGTSDEGSDAIDACACAPGYELNTVDQTCDACPAGSVGDGATPCMACTGDEYADNNVCGTCADGEIAVFVDSGSPANDGMTGNTQCHECTSPEAPTLTAGAWSCAPCPYLEYRNPTTGECVACPYTVGAAADGNDGAVRITNDGDAGATEESCPTPNFDAYTCGALNTGATNSLDDDSYACTLKRFCPGSGGTTDDNTLTCPSNAPCDGTGTPHVCNCPAGYAFVAPGDGGVARCSLAPSNAQQGTPATLTLTGTALTAATDNTPIEVGGPPSDPPANPPVQVVIQLPAGPTATPVSPIRICATRSDLVVTVSADANPAGSSFGDNTGAGAATTPLFEFSTASGCVVPQEVRITGVDMGNRGTQPLVAVGAGTPLPKLVLNTVVGTLGNQPFSGVQHVFLDGCELEGTFAIGASGGTRRRSVAPGHVINVAGAAKAATSNALAAEE